MMVMDRMDVEVRLITLRGSKCFEAQDVTATENIFLPGLEEVSKAISDLLNEQTHIDAVCCISLYTYVLKSILPTQNMQILA